MDPQQQASQIQPTDNPPSTVQPHPKSNILLLSLGVVVLVGIGLLGGYVLFANKTTPSQNNPPYRESNPSPTVLQGTTVQPTVNQASDLKIYSNTKYGYTLKYSPDSRLKEFSCSSQKALTEGDDVFVLDEVNSSFPQCGFGGYSWPISISVENSQLDCTSTDGYSATKTNIVVSGIATIRCDKKLTGAPQGPQPATLTYVFVPKNAKYYRFDLGNQKYADTFDQILSTFTFQQ